MTKKQQRRQAYDARNAQINKAQLSEIICNKFLSQVEYLHADTVMWYLHCRSEVQTLKVVAKELGSTKRIVIPYCTEDHSGQPQLGLWHLNDLSELVAGTWGILEPPRSQWGKKGREVNPQELDLIMVPGVAFDSYGGRLGNGAGYYDRLFQTINSDAILTAVCYQTQICDKVIMEKHDVFMDRVITEERNTIINKNGSKFS